MPELDVAAVEQYTQGRLAADDPETGRLLAAALSAIRAYCGWHVTPVKTGEVVYMDGPGSNTLILPTLKLITLTEIRERVTYAGGDMRETVYADTDLQVSSRGIVRKRFAPAAPAPYPWWTSELGGVDVKMTHGFTDEEAADWQGVVLSAVDRASTLASGGIYREIGPFVYGEGGSFGAGSQFSDAERATLDLYRLEPEP